jgi:hypothetical protein
MISIVSLVDGRTPHPRCLPTALLPGKKCCAKRRSTIAASRELLYGMLRVFEVMSDTKAVVVRVFRAESDATEWLSTPASA